MARRAYRQSRLVILAASMSDYLRRFGRFLAFTVAFASLSLALATVIGAVSRQPDISLPNLTQLGLHRLFDFVPAPSGFVESAHGTGGTFVALARLFGFALSCLYAGFSVAILGEPINVIRFSRYAVVDFKNAKLKIAYWVRLPEWSYLTHASAEIFLMRAERTEAGPLRTTFLFRWDVPREDDEFPQNEYASIRGVRYFEVPLNAESDYKGSVTLLAALDEFLDPLSDVAFSVVVQGVGADGRAVQATKLYPAREVLCGYDFVSIRKDDVARTYEAALEGKGELPLPRRGAGRKAVLFYEHFNCVNRISAAPDSVCVLQAGDAWSPEGRRLRYRAKVPVPTHVRLHDARPEPLYELEFGEVAERTFKAKELALAFRERMARVRLRLARLTGAAPSDAGFTSSVRGR